MTPPNSAADRSGPRDRLLWSALIFAVAFLMRAVSVVQLRGARVHQILMGDSRSYHAWAREIAAGDWLGNEVFYQAPLYPYFLALLYRTVGEDPFTVRMLQALIGAGSCVLLARAGWSFFSTRAGVAAGLLFAVYPPAVFADGTLEKSVLVMFLLSLSLALLGGLASRPRVASCIALGAAIGALVLVRENALVLVPVVLAWLALCVRGEDVARRLVLAAAFTGGIALVLLPVALRNQHVGGEFHLTTSQLGPNLYIGNNPAARGTYAPLLAGRSDPRYERADATAVAERATGRELSPGKVSDFYARAVFDWIRAQPADWLALMGRKLALAVNAAEIVDTEDQYTHAETSLPLKLGAVLHFGVLAPLALFGAWITWGDRRRLLPLYLLLGAYLASLVSFYVFARYRLPLATILLLFAGAAIVGLPAFVRGAPRAQVAAALFAAAVAAIACNWRIVDLDYMRSVTHYNLGNELAAAGQTEEAIGEYREAIQRFEGNAEAHNNLGALLASRGDLASARERYERALAIAPGYVDARLNLARALHDTGDLPGALAEIDRALALAPGRADAYHELGVIHSERGELALAIRNLERAIELDPGLAEARADLARAIETRSRERRDDP